MFDNVNGARLAVKRVQNAFGLRAAPSRELVARAAGWTDWHNLEKTVGTSAAPRRRDGRNALIPYLRQRGIVVDPDALLRIVEPTHEPRTPSEMLISEGAARILAALHGGCTVEVSRDGDAWLRTYTQAPYTRSLAVPSTGPCSEPLFRSDTILRRVEDEPLFADATWHNRETPPPASWRPGRLDMEKARRLDVWDGQGGRVDFLDVIMLMRGGLVVEGTTSGVVPTARGHAVAQAMVGDGITIETGAYRGIVAAHPLVVVPDHTVAVGKPSGFGRRAARRCRPIVTIARKGGVTSLQPHTDEVGVAPYVGRLAPAIARSLAAFLHVAPGTTTESVATFGDVTATITGRDGAVTLGYGRDHDEIEMTFGRAHVMLMAAHIADPAVDVDDEIVLHGVDVRWTSTWALAPETLAA